MHVVASKINAASREGMVWPNTKKSVRCVWKATEEASKTDGFGLITRGEIALGDRLQLYGRVAAAETVQQVCVLLLYMQSISDRAGRVLAHARTQPLHGPHAGYAALSTGVVR